MLHRTPLGFCQFSHSLHASPRSASDAHSPASIKELASYLLTQVALFSRGIQDTSASLFSHLFQEIVAQTQGTALQMRILNQEKKEAPEIYKAALGAMLAASLCWLPLSEAVSGHFSCSLSQDRVKRMVLQRPAVTVASSSAKLSVHRQWDLFLSKVSINLQAYQLNPMHFLIQRKVCRVQ